MKYGLLFAALFGVATGVLAVVAGGADDSPGLQLIGVGFVAAAVWMGVRAVRESEF